MWDNNLVAEANLARMGLRANANNKAIRPLAYAKAEARGRVAEGDEVARLFGVYRSPGRQRGSPTPNTMFFFVSCILQYNRRVNWMYTSK